MGRALFHVPRYYTGPHRSFNSYLYTAVIRVIEGR